MSTDERGETPDKHGSGQDVKQVKKEEAEEQSDYCCFCESDPCVVTELEDMLNEILMEYRDSKSNKEIRYCMYTDSVRYMHGYLGRGNRKRVPKCLEDRIHYLAPDEEYTGFIPSQEQFE